MFFKQEREFFVEYEEAKKIVNRLKDTGIKYKCYGFDGINGSRRPYGNIYLVRFVATLPEYELIVKGCDKKKIYKACNIVGFGSC